MLFSRCAPVYHCHFSFHSLSLLNEPQWRLLGAPGSPPGRLDLTHSTRLRLRFNTIGGYSGSAYTLKIPRSREAPKITPPPTPRLQGICNGWGKGGKYCQKPSDLNVLKQNPLQKSEAFFLIVEFLHSCSFFSPSGMQAFFLPSSHFIHSEMDPKRRKYAYTHTLQ